MQLVSTFTSSIEDCEQDTIFFALNPREVLDMIERARDFLLGEDAYTGRVMVGYNANMTICSDPGFEGYGIEQANIIADEDFEFPTPEWRTELQRISIGNSAAYMTCYGKSTDVYFESRNIEPALREWERSQPKAIAITENAFADIMALTEYVAENTEAKDFVAMCMEGGISLDLEPGMLSRWLEEDISRQDLAIRLLPYVDMGCTHPYVLAQRVYSELNKAR